ncbi:MAG: prenyltransferase, partial [Dysgonamonadaceae bacterium]|nr:prenyltransferase [Dysgonamonadaceae bacterium]
VLFISIPVGLLVANIVFVHSIIDSEADREVGKMTFARLLGGKRGQLAGLLGVFLISYGSIILGVAMNKLSVFYLAVLLTLPMAAALFYLVWQILYRPEKQFFPKRWYGPMGDFKKYQQAQMDWFMLRWLLARNLLTLFCLIIIVVVFVE